MRSLLSLPFLMIVVVAALLTGCSSGDDNEPTQVRLMNVSPGYASLDFYANGPDDDTDQLKITGVAYDSVSAYTALGSGTYTVKLKRNGVSSTLQSASGKNLADGTHHTFVAYGSVGHFSSIQLGDDVTPPVSGQAKVQLLNVAEAGGLDVFLTESSVALDDASPVFASVASGGTGAAVTIDSGDYRLRVTGASDTDDLRLDVPNITVASRQVVTVILTATAGGVLVDAVLLPQQGELTKYANTKARVRGAVGISNGTVVTARVGGVGILSSAAIGVVGNYAQVEAGSTAVTLSVNGAPLDVPNQSLSAGGEYTLLVWSNTGGTQTTLIEDDNRLPTTSGKAKIRVINGLSALDVPITLAVDFSPVAEGIALGQASAFAEIDDGSEYQLDVSNTDTAASLLSRSSVSLVSPGVYTMLMSVNGTTVGGTLRKDR
jgi:hypothetical protein